jgi:hypothetical protein
LKIGCTFLDFPAEEKIGQYMVENSDFAKRKEEDPYDGLSNADMSPI